MLCSCTNWVTSSFQQTIGHELPPLSTSGVVWKDSRCILISVMLLLVKYITQAHNLNFLFSLVFSSHFLLHLFPVIMIRHSSMILSWNKFGVTVDLVITGWWGPDSKCWRTREADRKTDKGERPLVFFLLQMLLLELVY